MTIRICVAGVTGWTGSCVARGVIGASDMALAAAVSRTGAGREISAVLDVSVENSGPVVVASLAEALETPLDVLIDYTSTSSVKAHTLAALEKGVSVVIGTSGLTAADYQDIDAAARANGVGAVSGNFSLTAALMQYLSKQAARHVPAFEILDYAWAEKEDVPSGTARELAEILGDVRQPSEGRAIDTLIGPTETRGASINGVRVHSLRLPGYTLRCEAVFGLAGERLVISHEAGQSADPYVFGSLVAARKLPAITGLVRGLDALLFE